MASVPVEQQNIAANNAQTISLPTVSETNVRLKGRKVSLDEIQLVQSLIERCLQLYMTQQEVISALQAQANIEPAFTALVWQKLEDQNPPFFKAYNLRLRVKDQITAFNYLVSQQAQLEQNKLLGDKHDYKSLTIVPTSNNTAGPTMSPLGLSLGPAGGNRTPNFNDSLLYEASLVDGFNLSPLYGSPQGFGGVFGMSPGRLSGRLPTSGLPDSGRLPGGLPITSPLAGGQSGFLTEAFINSPLKDGDMGGADAFFGLSGRQTPTEEKPTNADPPT